MSLLQNATCLRDIRAMIEDKLASFPHDAEYLAMAEAAGMSLPREAEPPNGMEE